MLALLPLLAALITDPLTSNRAAIQLLERSLEAHGSDKDIKMTLSIRGDIVSEGQSQMALAPFESYPFFVNARIDRPAKKVRIDTRSEIAGDFVFDYNILMQDGKGFALTPELKSYDELTNEPGILNRYFPHRIVAQALASRSSLRLQGENRVTFATSNGQWLTLDIDPETNLLHRVEQVAPLGIWGDGVRQTIFEDYRPLGALMLPSRMRLVTKSSVHGSVENVYRYEARAEADISPKDLALPEGYIKSDWSYRPMFNARPLAKDVYLLENVSSTNGQWSYNVLAVVFDEFVLVAEAPVSSGTTENVLEKIRALAPGKPIRYLVQSHHHNDHLGGIRSYVAEGTTILTGETAKPLIEKIAAAPFFLDPDRLHRQPRAPKIETIAAPRTVRDDHHEAVIYNIGPNPHAKDMLIVHLPKEKILWQSDMINDREYPKNETTADFEAKLATLGLEVNTIVGLHGRDVKR